MLVEIAFVPKYFPFALISKRLELEIDKMLKTG